jgi:aminoglycoside 3-N-acetyltransferase
MPLYDPNRSPTTSMGVVAETFRKRTGVLRSSHPHCSFAAGGRQAEQVVAHHALDYALGEQSPIARLYEIGGWVLMLGAPKDRNTSMHLAEYRLPQGLRGHKIWRFPIRIVGGKTEWDSYDDVMNEDDDFDRIHETFLKETGLVREGRVGSAKTYLMPVRDLVDFAVEWMIANRQERT